MIIHHTENSNVHIFYTEYNGNYLYHNDTGPAIIYSNGLVLYYQYDKDVTDEVNQWLKERNIEDWKTMTEEDKLALSFFMRSL